MILPDDTPGLKEALQRNAELARQGIWPEPILDVPSLIVIDEEKGDLLPVEEGALRKTRREILRMPDGRFAPKGQGSVLRGKPRRARTSHLGVTPYRGAGKSHDTDYYATTRFKGFEADARRLAAEHGLKITGFKRVRGVWQGGGEPSTVLSLHSKLPFDEHDAAVAEVMDALGSKYNQDGVIRFRSDSEGKSLRYHSRGKVDQKRVTELLDSGEYPMIFGATFLPDGRLEIINLDANPDTHDQALALAVALGGEFRYTRGNADLRSIEEDYARPDFGRRDSQEAAGDRGPDRGTGSGSELASRTGRSQRDDLDLR